MPINDTDFVHKKKLNLAPGNSSLESPVYHSVKYTYDSLAEMEQGFTKSDTYLYSRISSPTVRELEINLAHLLGQEEAIVSASGMSAMATMIMGVLRAGDELVMFIDSYGTARQFAKNILSRFGIITHFLNIADLDQLTVLGQTNKQIKMIFFESLTNPMVRVPNTERIIEIAKKFGWYVAIDGTFAGLDTPKNWDVDFYVHSLTKFASGHGDTLGGLVAGKANLFHSIKTAQILTGPSLDPGSAFLIMRGLETYPLRRRQMCLGALEVAKWCAEQPFISRVFYPGLPNHPEHELAKTQLKDSGSIIAINIKQSHVAKMANFVERLKIIKLAASLGANKSLIAPINLFYAKDLTGKEKQQCFIEPGSLRLSVGIEAPSDLIEDLEQAAKVFF